jgi:hypothetical protein
VIFTAQQARAIARGRKTQTRIPWITGRFCPVKVGHDYPVQVRHGRKLDSVSRITVLGRGQQRAGDITLTEARAEGCRTTDDWKAQWVRRFDAPWVQREKIDLVAVYDDKVSIVNWILLERFRQRHESTIVWAIAFEPVVDAPRYLARPTRTSGDYVTNPGRAIDLVEAIDKPTLERYAEATQAEGERRRASFRLDLEAERQRRRNLRVR